MKPNLKLKTAQAAEVAGVGYEGFRTWLKRGLLKDTGVIPKFYASSGETEVEVTDAKRWRWSAFGFADLCCFRLTKLMLDAGLSWNMSSGAASDQKLWQDFHSSPGSFRHVAVFDLANQYTLYSHKELSADLDSGTVKYDWMTIFDLQALRKNVIWRSRAVILRVVATDIANTSNIFAVSGPKMLSKAETSARQARIEQLAERINGLAVDAERGDGSFRDFEAILGELHSQGMFPDNASVSAVASAFAEPSLGP